jgi:hypothetical protein
MRMLADPVLGWEGEMGPVNKFFNTGQICTKQVTSLESWILSEGRPAMGISFPLGSCVQGSLFSFLFFFFFAVTFDTQCS